jgi:hypothetical protein
VFGEANRRFFKVVLRIVDQPESREILICPSQYEAQHLRLTIPGSFLLRAHKVIE